MAKECLKELKSADYPAGEMPMVSVVMIAYNVGQYISEAIESVLAQQTNFKVELVIGEDCSTDNTREIALVYQQKYPGIIRVLLHKQNLGLTPNCIATHNASKGKYIALLDGDDYWTNPEKLQKQVDFLDNNNDFSACAHQAMKIYDNGSSKPIPFGEQKDAVYGVNDTITHRKFHTSALLYRKWIWDKTGGIPPDISSNERAIYPMVAIFGKIKYFKEPMCVYRFSGFGLSSRIDHNELQTDLKMLPWLKKLSPGFPVFKFRSFLYLCFYTYSTMRIPIFQLLKYYFGFVVFSFSYFPKNLGDVKFGTTEVIRLVFKYNRLR